MSMCSLKSKNSLRIKTLGLNRNCVVVVCLAQKGKMGHAISKMGSDVKGAVRDVVHVAKKGLHAAQNVAVDAEHATQGAIGEVHKLAADADHVVTTVGGTVAGLASHIPVVGSTLNKGLTGATDLLHRQIGNVARIASAAEHPIDAINNAIDVVKHPHKLLGIAGKIIHTAQHVAGDVGHIIGAVKVVAPEFAPELAAIEAAANVVAHPTIDSVMKAVSNVVPEAGNARKIFNTAKAVTEVVQHPTVAGVLKAVSHFVPNTPLAQKALKAATTATKIGEKGYKVFKVASKPGSPRKTIGSASHVLRMKHAKKSRPTSAKKGVKRGRVKADATFGEELVYHPSDVLFTDPIEYSNRMLQYGKLMHHFFRQGQWIGSAELLPGQGGGELRAIYYPIIDKTEPGCVMCGAEQ